MIIDFTVFTQICLSYLHKGKIGWHMQLKAQLALFISLPRKARI